MVSSSNYKTTFGSLSYIYRTESFAGLYKGTVL